MTRRAGVPAIVAVAAAIAAATGAADAPPPETPRDVGLTERASTRLAQIDVTVSGPKAAIGGLTAADFEVRLNDRLVPHVIVDALCGEARDVQPAPPGDAAPRRDAVAATPAPHGTAPTPVTYLLYFDQPHLTQAGRQASIEAARAMLPKLMAGGNRAMLVSSAKNLRTLVPLTTDGSRIDAALAAMVNDIQDFDPYATTEENRLSEVVHELSLTTDRAVSLARRYAQEERSEQERDLNRLRMVLGRLADLDPPKAVLYFADTMRANPGEHYLSFFSGATVADRNGVPTAGAADIQLSASTGVLPLDRVVNEASANGIRFYTVEGQGLTGPLNLIQSDSSATSGGGGGVGNQAQPQLNHQRIRDSQSTLATMAAETGGRAFLNGISAARMASQILDDLSCVYLLSFDPAGWPEDKPLTVSVKVDRPKVRTVVRGRLVIQGESNRLTARLLSAYGAPTAKPSTFDLKVGMIPIGFKDGRFQARVQVAVPPSAIPGTTWDLGASIVSRGSVSEDGSGRISVANAGVPVVWEKDMEFAPGDYDLIAVGHEATTDDVTSKEVRGRWPNLEDELASLGPIAVSQPSKGGFLVNGKAHTSGAVVLGEADPLRAGDPTAVISLVCRAGDERKPLTVVRTLIGDTETPVGTTDVDMGSDRCAQILDLIRPHTLGPGSYRFVVAVSRDGTELTRGEARMFVPDEPAAAPPAPVVPAGPAGS